MSDIQRQLLKVGLTTDKKINEINREMAVVENLKRVSKKIESGLAKPADWEKYSRLKRRASRDVKFAF
ncbi:MAG: hypothetical protein NUV82_01320 [Candidatus Komeilibacteria bacterium]|nr:hypothetical protein [Candidatus Komeilibacteria bacterium]